MYDRCLTLEILWDRGSMESVQINAIMQVSEEMGTKGHILSACFLQLLARLKHQVCFCMHGIAES